MAKTTKSRANAATNGTTAAAPANDTAPKVPNDAAVTSTGGDFHPSSPTRRRPAATVPNDGAVALGLEPWQLWVEDDRVSLGTLLLRTLVDTTEPGGDVVGGALEVLRQDLDLLAAAATTTDQDTDELGYAILRASRRVGTIIELRRRIASASPPA
jgi:hypothetical protein